MFMHLHRFFLFLHWLVGFAFLFSLFLLFLLFPVLLMLSHSTSSNCKILEGKQYTSLHKNNKIIQMLYNCSVSSLTRAAVFCNSVLCTAAVCTCACKIREHQNCSLFK